MVEQAQSADTGGFWDPEAAEAQAAGARIVRQTVAELHALSSSAVGGGGGRIVGPLATTPMAPMAKAGPNFSLGKKSAGIDVRPCGYTDVRLQQQAQSQPANSRARASGDPAPVVEQAQSADPHGVARPERRAVEQAKSADTLAVAPVPAPPSSIALVIQPLHGTAFELDGPTWCVQWQQHNDGRSEMTLQGGQCRIISGDHSGNMIGKIGTEISNLIPWNMSITLIQPTLIDGAPPDEHEQLCGEISRRWDNVVQRQAERKVKGVQALQGRWVFDAEAAAPSLARGSVWFWINVNSRLHHTLWNLVAAAAHVQSPFRYNYKRDVGKAFRMSMCTPWEAPPPPPPTGPRPPLRWYEDRRW